MAKFTCVGLEGLEAELARHAELLPAAAPEMLKAGTDILADYQRGSIIEKGLVDSGDMCDSIKANEMEYGSDGYSQEVYPHGRDHKGTSNALKAFIHEYGTSASDARNGRGNKKWGFQTPNKNIDASHWMSEANDAAKDEILDEMRSIWNEHIKNK